MIERLRAAWRAFRNPPVSLIEKAHDEARDPEGSEEIVRQAKQAERIFNDPVFQRAVRDADEALVSTWRDAVNQEDREKLWHRQAALEQVLHQMRIIVSDGQKEEHGK